MRMESMVRPGCVGGNLALTRSRSCGLATFGTRASPRVGCRRLWRWLSGPSDGRESPPDDDLVRDPRFKALPYDLDLALLANLLPGEHDLALGVLSDIEGDLFLKHLPLLGSGRICLAERALCLDLQV